MRIVVLDGYTLNPGDLGWAGLAGLGDVTLFDRTPGDLVVARAADAEALLTNKTPLGDDAFRRLPSLKYIGVLATGYNVVDVRAAEKRGIVVTNIPTYGTRSVVQMTFALLLELCQHVQNHSNAVHQGEWTANRDFCFWKHPLVELAGKTLGIVGFGRIGQGVADVASAFGMKVIGYDSFRTDQSKRADFRWAELDELLSESDVVSLHCPLFAQTKGMINAESLKLMKRSALLVNTSRGPLIVEQDLAEALNRGDIAGAGLDVLSTEPPTPDNPLLTAPNCIITPHIAWATREARSRLMDIAVDNLAAYMRGNPVNTVNT